MLKSTATEVAYRQSGTHEGILTLLASVRLYSTDPGTVKGFLLFVADLHGISIHIS